MLEEANFRLCFAEVREPTNEETRHTHDLIPLIAGAPLTALGDDVACSFYDRSELSASRSVNHHADGPH